MAKNQPYLRIPIAAAEALAESKSTDFSVYLPGADGAEPVLYRETGMSNTPGHLDRLRRHGVQTVFVRSENLRECEQIIERRLSDLLEDPDVTPDAKAALVNQVGTALARDLTSGPVDGGSIDRAEQLVDNVITSVLNDPAVAAHIVHMAAHERTTASHMFIVSALAVVLGAEVFGADDPILAELGLAGLMHDLGKLAISATILNKTSTLTEEETTLIHQHPIESVRLLGVSPKVSPRVRQMILQHHEWIDGNGYPIGLRGADVLLCSRVLSVVDCYHAMTGRRAYRPPLTPKEATMALLAQADRQFDPQVLKCWTTVMDRCRSLADTIESPPALDEPEELSSRHEHRAMDRRRKSYGLRAKRFSCSRKVAASCLYAGRLPEVNDVPTKFDAPILDISRGGICIGTSHPCYRGEIIHVQIVQGAKRIWVRTSVAWCTQIEIGCFYVGLRFIRKLTDAEALLPVDAQSATAPDAPIVEINSPAGEAPGPEAKDAETADQIDAGQLMEQIRKRSARGLSPDDEKPVLVQSESDDPAIRKRAVELLPLGKTKFARLALLRLLRDSDDEVREQMVITAGAIKMVEAAHILRDALNDPIESLALRAAGALGRIGENDGLPLVAHHLKRDGPLTRMATVVLGEITGNRFPGNAHGIQAARRYLAAKPEIVEAR